MIKISHKSRENDLVKKVEEISGENLFACYQCGKCSAGCPSIDEMDIAPNQVIRFLQLGDERSLDAKAIWLCASCFTCAVRCPKGVSLTNIMEALRQIILRKNVDQMKPEDISKEEMEELPQIALVSSFRKFTA